MVNRELEGCGFTRSRKSEMAHLKATESLGMPGALELVGEIV